MNIEFGCVNQPVSASTKLSQYTRFSPDSFQKRFSMAQGMMVPGVAVALQERLFVGFQEDDLKAMAQFLEVLKYVRVIP